MKQWLTIEYDTGDTITYYNGIVNSRDGAPAIITNNGYRLWFENGKLHNIAGPAVIDPHGEREFWVEGKQTFGINILGEFVE